MLKSDLPKIIKSNIYISKSTQLILNAIQIYILKMNGFKHLNHNIFINEDLKIYTSIENCFSLNNPTNNKILDALNYELYSYYLFFDNNEIKKLIKKINNYRKD